VRNHSTSGVIRNHWLEDIFVRRGEETISRIDREDFQCPRSVVGVAKSTKCIYKVLLLTVCSIFQSSESFSYQNLRHLSISCHPIQGSTNSIGR
jgi:hypothetical protein